MCATEKTNFLGVAWHKPHISYLRHESALPDRCWVPPGPSRQFLQASTCPPKHQRRWDTKCATEKTNLLQGVRDPSSMPTHQSISEGGTPCPFPPKHQRRWDPCVQLKRPISSKGSVTFGLPLNNTFLQGVRDPLSIPHQSIGEGGTPCPCSTLTFRCRDFASSICGEKSHPRGPWLPPKHQRKWDPLSMPGHQSLSEDPMCASEKTNFLRACISEGGTPCVQLKRPTSSKGSVTFGLPLNNTFLQGVRDPLSTPHQCIGEGGTPCPCSTLTFRCRDFASLNLW